MKTSIFFGELSIDLMKKTNKTLIIIGVLACFLFNLTLADNSDCQFFENHVYSQKGASSN